MTFEFRFSVESQDLDTEGKCPVLGKSVCEHSINALIRIAYRLLFSYGIFDIVVPNLF